MTLTNTQNRSLSIAAALAIFISTSFLVVAQPASATTVSIGGASVTVSPSGASGQGTDADPLVYPSSISFGTQVSWAFTAPSTITACSVSGGHYSLTSRLSGATTSATVCEISGSIVSDEAGGRLIVYVSWGANSIDVHTTFQPQFSYGSNAVSTSMTLTGTSGLEIGSTVSIATRTEWKNPYLNNSLSPSDFYGFAFISRAKCGEQNSSYTRVYFNNADWNFAVNGFQIPSSATDANGQTIADLTGYGIQFHLHPTSNNMMSDRVGPFKIGESTLVTCTHPFSGGGGSGGLGGGNPGPQAPARYAGPEFSGLGGLNVTPGAGAKATGKKMNEISSVAIAGKAIAFKATETELSFDVPADLAPGSYDIVITSPWGKLTHLNAVVVAAAPTTVVRTPTQVSMTAEGLRFTLGELFQGIEAARSQDPGLNKVRCVVSAPTLALAKAQAQRLCDQVVRANDNLTDVVVDPRVRPGATRLQARLHFGWTK